MIIFVGAFSCSSDREIGAEDEPGGDIALSMEASPAKSEELLISLTSPNPRLVGPAVNAAIRDNLET